MILKSQHEVPIFNVLIYFGDFHLGPLGPLSLEDWETRPCSTRWLRFAISTYARDSTKAKKKCQEWWCLSLERQNLVSHFCQEGWYITSFIGLHDIIWWEFCHWISWWYPWDVGKRKQKSRGKSVGFPREICGFSRDFLEGYLPRKKSISCEKDQDVGKPGPTNIYQPSLRFFCWPFKKKLYRKVYLGEVRLGIFASSGTIQ